MKAKSMAMALVLAAADGAVVYGRTMEWGSFDLHSRVVVVPRGYKYSGHTPDGKSGLAWQTKYGVLGPANRLEISISNPWAAAAA